MSSRYHGRGDARYAARDPSPPPRPFDRRHSNHYSGPSPSARGHNDSSYRANEVHSHHGPGREPPRGPKAYLGTRGGGYIPRGRGFIGRGEARDRDFRDIRDHSIARRGREQREWGRRERDFSRERRPSPTGRNRSRSPNHPRDFRDNRDLPPREADAARSRRASREGYGQPSPTISDTPHSAGPTSRGGFFGRGRGDWDYGRRGRGSFDEEREPYRARSRSRERIWERKPVEDPRDRDRNQGQIASNRDENFTRDWDDRERQPARRETFAQRRDASSSAATQENFPASHTVYRPGQHRSSYDARSLAAEASPRLPSNSVASSNSSVAREVERADSNAGPIERESLDHRASSPPQAPQVPAFGSIIYQPPKPQSMPSTTIAGQDDAPAEPEVKFPNTNIPSGPKAQIPSSLPTGPKADQNNIGANAKDNFTNNTTSAPNFSAGASVSRVVSGVSDLLTEPTKDSRQPPDSPQTSFTRSPNFSTSLRGGDIRYGNTSSFNAMGSNRNNGQDYSSQNSPLKIPTGPRAERITPSARPPLPSPGRTGVSRPSMVPRGPQRGMGSLRWVRPGLQPQIPRGPSMMGSMIHRRDYMEEENTGSIESEGENSENEAPVGHSEPPTSHPVLEVNSQALDSEQPVQSLPQLEEQDHGVQATHIVEVQEDVQPSKPPEVPLDKAKSESVDVTAMEDEHMDMDEEYLADERKFEQNLREIESRRPATPKHHVQLLGLLDEIDALAIAAEIRANGAVYETAKIEEIGEKTPFNYKAKIDHWRTVRTVTPPLECLPYLSSGPPTPFSEMDDLEEGNGIGDLINTHIIEELTARVQLEDSAEDEVKRQFAQDYKSWRLYVEGIEDQKRAQKGASSVPDTPAITALPLTQTLNSLEGRRPAARNSSQFDYDRVMEESRRSANEEAQRRQQEAQDADNSAKEAVIPQMLKKHEAAEISFLDNTNRIDPRNALDVLGYHPKVDDFTAEEHRLFIDAFLADPKKFGAIARKIPGRSYQECIQHYYLTKQDGQYKERFNSRARRGRGRGIRGGSGRPRAAPSSLLSNSFGDDPAVVAVTESGRPRRTAAPTFGAGGDGELVAQTTTPARRNLSGTKADAGGDTPTEKPTAKRTRTGAGKEKGVRKPKTQLLAAAPGPSPQKVERETTRDRSKEPKLENEQQQDEMKTAELLANLSNPQSGPTPLPGNDIWTNSPPITVSTSNIPQRSQYTVQESFQPQSKGVAPISSYWSVPEQTDFNNLIHVFGTNWQAIADHMKTKTQTMVKNYYHRQVDRGESKLIEQAALAADEKIKRGENMGQPPPATIVPKRRYDTGPQIAPQRQLAPSVESMEIDKDSPSLRPTKPAPISPPQFPQGSQRFSTILQPEPVPKTSITQSVQNATSSPSARSGNQTLQQRVQPPHGPRIGFFNDHARTLQPQPQQTQQSRQQEERQPQGFNKSSSLQEFQEAFQPPHRARQQDTQSMASKYQQPTQAQQPIGQIAQTSHSRQHSQVRIAPSQSSNVDLRPQVAPPQQLHSQPPQQQLQSHRHEPNQNEILRRLESNGPGRQSNLQSLTASRLPQTFSPPPAATRPSSVPAPAATPQPPKRSNIMNILNDESAEPPPRKKHSEAQPSVPTPPPQSPARHMYHQPIQSTQPYPRRDVPAEPSHAPQQHHHHRTALSQLLSQQQPPSREAAPSTNWAEVVQRKFSDRSSNYQPQVVEAPRVQPSFSQQASRAPLQVLQRSEAPTPSSTYAHSRTSSYASLHPQQQQPQPHQQGQQPPQASTQATPVLQPSPYAQIHPQHMQAQHPHTQTAQQIQILQQQQQQQLRESDPISQHQQQYLRQQEAMRVQQQQQRPDPFRTVVQPSEQAARQQQQQEIQQQQYLRSQREVRESREPGMLEELARREREREREEIVKLEEGFRREELAARRNTYTHTPPGYPHGGGGGYPQPQDRRPTPRGYDERDRR